MKWVIVILDCKKRAIAVVGPFDDEERAERYRNLYYSQHPVLPMNAAAI